MEKSEIFNIGISTGEYEDFIREIIELSGSDKGGYVCVANVHMIVEAYNNNEFSNVVNNADIVTPDGKPLALMLKLLYRKKQIRVAGMDLFPDLLKISEKRDLPVFFYGSTEEVLEKVKIKLASDYPDLTVSGLISPPFESIAPELIEQHIKDINRGKPGIIFMILGCPKQEKMMAEMSGRIKGVMIGVGAAVSVFVGEIRRAPLWMQRFYLEWFYRFLQEPGRLWKRYLYTNTKFIFLSFRELVRRKILKKRDSV